MRRPEVRKLADVVLLLMGDDGRSAALLHNGDLAAFPTDDLVPDMAKAQLACPLCGKTDTLYENVTVRGWRSVVGHEIVEMDETVVVPTISDGRGALSREVEWDSVEHENYACSECNADDTYLPNLAFVVPPKMGWDGEPIPPPIPGQGELEVKG